MAKKQKKPVYVWATKRNFYSSPRLFYAKPIFLDGDWKVSWLDTLVALNDLVPDVPGNLKRYRLVEDPE